MKYSFMTFSTPELNINEIINVAKKYGYDGVEPRLFANHKHGIEIDATSEFIQDVKKKFYRTGIEISALATSAKYSDPSTAKENIETTIRVIKLASEINCKRIRVFGGSIPDGIKKGESKISIIDSLKKIGPIAKEYGVYVCLETHDSWRDPDDVAAIMKNVDEDYICVNWDIMHPIVDGFNMEYAFKALAPWIEHMHVHDGDYDVNMMPIGTGVIDHKKALELIKSIEYEGFISGEWINWEEYDIHLPREIATLRSYEKGEV